MGPKDIIDSTFSIFEKYSTWRQLKKDTGAILRLLYLESKRNINLIACIKDEKAAKDSKTQDSDYKEIIAAMETEILEIIFMAGKSNSKVFDFMSNPSEFELYDDDGDGDETSDIEKPLNALSFLYVKIWTIKKLSIMDQKTVLKKINYRTRLKNIKSAYTSLLINLEKVPEIKTLVK